MIEVAVGIEPVVAHIVEPRSMQRPGPRLRKQADFAPAVAAVFSGVPRRHDLELRDRVGVGVEGYAVVEQIVVVCPVEQERNGIGAVARDGEAGDPGKPVGIHRQHAGLQQREVEHVPGNQRCLTDGVARHDIAEARRSVHIVIAVGDLDGDSGPCDRQQDLQKAVVPHVQFNPSDLGGREPGFLCFDDVASGL